MSRLIFSNNLVTPWVYDLFLATNKNSSEIERIEIKILASVSSYKDLKLVNKRG